MTDVRCQYDDPAAPGKIAEAIRSHWQSLKKTYNCLRPVVVCIGSDYSTGDALGPVVGSALARNSAMPVYGTMEEPIHADNLATKFDIILHKHPDGFFVVIDSATSDRSPAGTVVAYPGPLKPGAGIGKNLPSFGEFSVIGIVGRPIEKAHPLLGKYITTPEIRLYVVLQMAAVIRDAVKTAFDQEVVCRV
ncbi:MAG: spore protease YyaC [Desulfomonilaceae bacterium]